MKPGIYKTNRTKNKVIGIYGLFRNQSVFNEELICLYVGSSLDVLGRIDTHKRQLKSGKHKNKLLLDEFSKGDALDFTWKILRVINDPSITEKELLVIEQSFLNNLLPPLNQVPANLETCSDQFKLLCFNKMLRCLQVRQFNKKKNTI